MWRALFLAVGISMVIVGGECLLIDNAVLDKSSSDDNVKEDTIDPLTGYAVTTPAAETTEDIFTPPEWAPWSLLSAGTIVLLYAVALRRRPSE